MTPAANDVPTAPASGVRPSHGHAHGHDNGHAHGHVHDAATVCHVLDVSGAVLFAGPFEEALRLMNRQALADCVVREHDGALLATPMTLRPESASAYDWLRKFGWVVA